MIVRTCNDAGDDDDCITDVIVFASPFGKR